MTAVILKRIKARLEVASEESTQQKLDAILGRKDKRKSLVSKVYTITWFADGDGTELSQTFQKMFGRTPVVARVWTWKLPGKELLKLVSEGNGCRIVLNTPNKD